MLKIQQITLKHLDWTVETWVRDFQTNTDRAFWEFSWQWCWNYDQKGRLDLTVWVYLFQKFWRHREKWRKKNITNVKFKKVGSILFVFPWNNDYRKSKLVPLFILNDCWQAMKVLTDPEIRREAEIHTQKNIYIYFVSQMWNTL